MYIVKIAYAEPEEISGHEFPDDIILLDQNSTKTRKEAFKLKGHFAARMTPFCGIYDEDGNAIKGFYKEASKDPIVECLKFINYD